MANYATIHKRIARGKGKAARVLGQPFTQIRLDTSYGFRIVSNPIKPFKVLFRRIRGGPDHEQNFLISQVFEAIMDARRTLVGDVLIETQNYVHAQKLVTFMTNVDQNANIPHVANLSPTWQSYGPIYFVAQLRPIHRFILVRSEVLCQIRRPTFSCVDGDGGYSEQGRNSESVLTLRAGSGTFEFNSLTNLIDLDRVGLIPMQLEFAAARGLPPFRFPTDWPRNRWVFACPGNWPGLVLRENDNIITPDGYRYRVTAFHQPHAGPDIIQGVLEKLEA